MLVECRPTVHATWTGDWNISPVSHRRASLRNTNESPALGSLVSDMTNVRTNASVYIEITRGSVSFESFVFIMTFQCVSV